MSGRVRIRAFENSLIFSWNKWVGVMGFSFKASEHKVLDKINELVQVAAGRASLQ